MRYVTRRLGFFIVTLWACLTINFVLPRLMPGNPAVAMMARYKGRINGQALKALEIAFGVNSSESSLQSVLHLRGQHVHRALRDVAHLFPRPGLSGGLRRPAVDPRPRWHHDCARVCRRDPRRYGGGVATRQHARRRYAADLRHYFRFSVLLPGLDGAPGVLRHPRMVPSGLRVLQHGHRRVELALHRGRARTTPSYPPW